MQELTMTQLKVGDRVRCIKKPREGNYQCKVGAIATISKIIRTTLWTKEDICTKPSHDKSACYDTNNFVKCKPKISLKTILNK